MFIPWGLTLACICDRVRDADCSWRIARGQSFKQWLGGDDDVEDETAHTDLTHGRAPPATDRVADPLATQLLHTTEWGDLDFLIVDSPPGTGDVPRALATRVPLHGALVVTTPSRLATTLTARRRRPRRPRTAVGAASARTRSRCSWTDSQITRTWLFVAVEWGLSR